LYNLSFSGLETQLRTLLAIPPHPPVNIQYIDNENELITLTSDLELDEAVRVAAGGLLRVVVTFQPGFVLHSQPAPVQMQNAEFIMPPPKSEVSEDVVPIERAKPEVKEKKSWKEKKADRQEVKLARQQAKADSKLSRLQKKSGGQESLPQPEAHMPRERSAADKLVARHVKDVTFTDGTEIAPSTAFVKTWKMRNEGCVWPAGCRLMFVGRNSDQMGGPDFVPVPVEGPVQPNQEVDVSVPLLSPSEPGRFIGYWRLCTPEGKKFGQRVWVSITVTGSSSSSDDVVIAESSEGAYEELVQQIEQMGFNLKKKALVRLLQKHNGQLDKVVQVLNKRKKGLKTNV